MKLILNIFSKLTDGQASIFFSGFGGILYTVSTIFKNDKKIQKGVALSVASGITATFIALGKAITSILNKIK